MIQHSTNTIWVGMDVHQASITVAILHGSSPHPEVVRLAGDLNAARRLFRRLAAQGNPRACSTLILQRRRMGQDPAVVAIAVKAQHRLRRRYTHLIHTKHTNKAITAVAREL